MAENMKETFLEAVNSSVLSDNSKESLNFHCSYPQCKLSYSRQWKLDRHMCTHTGKRPFRCETAGCQKAYQSKSHLLRHVKSTHSVVLLLPCMFESCQQTFKDKWALIKHVKDHGRSKKFPCSVCPKLFVTANKLKTHELEHRGVFPFSCQVCPAKWPSRSLLQRHMKMHQTLLCQYQGCPKVFDCDKSLRKHLKLDHRTTYTCDHCKKSFNNKGILRDHVLIHLPLKERRLISCPYKPCKRVYLQKRNLTHHIKVFHNTKRFYCSVEKCGKTCISEKMLKRHSLQKHKIRGEESKHKIICQLANILPVSDFEHVVEEAQPPQYEIRVISHDFM